MIIVAWKSGLGLKCVTVVVYEHCKGDERKVREPSVLTGGGVVCCAHNPLEMVVYHSFCSEHFVKIEIQCVWSE